MPRNRDRSCSVLTAFTKAAVTEHVGADVDPGEALAKIRRLFGRLRTRRSMVTLLLAVWDPASRRLTVANSGHPPLLIYSAGSGDDGGCMSVAVVYTQRRVSIVSWNGLPPPDYINAFE